MEESKENKRNEAAGSEFESDRDEDLHDGTKIGSFTWAEKKEEVMDGRHLDEAWFVSNFKDDAGIGECQRCCRQHW